ncbi:MAG: hypothetical protein CMC82_01775 [Flavobacteriaceae bacterium]|nr:hypothetical protein [Flavobacteriaceae bacterium]|tara:strand:- start:929 stop:1120 length:192 start_codon:yes stop_codon:yes gene_type:complete
MSGCFDRPWHPEEHCKECGSPLSYDEDWECLVCKEKEDEKENGEFLGYKSYPFKTRKEHEEDE